ncbi:monovalent cation/H+ antiporter subunit A [Advenella sp. S44]|uniref:monovalent cation/H+ antiporter subunit A n=1 Tax=Advenella sp. S44 TaxID=1982755 RepID=UPI000C2B10F6|nr:monovalent cation/H+ antiporter subunit A [Advenella sp. S44]PJX23732.1 monovalent cation/H+ antiporter subunit A [Advenella sp. S44]
MSLILLLILPFLGSILVGLLPVHARAPEAWMAGIIAVIGALITLSLLPDVLQGNTIVQTLEWVPSYKLNLVFRMDGYAWLFSLLITVMGALVVLYARYYMSPRDPVTRFYAFFLAFMGSMLGVVLSGNIIQLVIFWELTSLSSFMLIAYWNHRQDAKRGARMALTITAAGGFCLLAAMLMIGHIVGSYDLGAVLDSGDLLRDHPWYLAILILFALGALTKSAQFPFHFWLPNAMAAPTPVSAYLHSATMVKAGVFILARFWPVLAGTSAWFWIIGMAGLCSLFLGAYAATFQRDMKAVLAYSTISHLGLITLLLGLNSKLALIAALFHMINHATFKASLFMATGIVDHETGTRDLILLSGLRKAMPITATLAVVAAAAMAGVPLLNGFISKEMFFAETLTLPDYLEVSSWLPVFAVLASAFSVAYSLRLILQVFFGPVATDLPSQPHEPPRWMLVPSGILVLLCLLIGIMPQTVIGPVLDSAAHSILGPTLPEYSLAIWHGFNLPLTMSLIAMGGGVLLMFVLRPLQRRSPGQTPLLYRIDGRVFFDGLMNLLDTVAYQAMTVFSTKRLQPQVLWIVVITVVVTIMPLLLFEAWPQLVMRNIDLPFTLLWIIGSCCAIGAAYQAKYNRFRSLVLLGGAGLCCSLTYLWLSAPDLALTQLVVEMVTTVLLLLGLRWLPRRMSTEPPSDRGRALVRRFRDMTIAVVAGLGMSILTYLQLSRPRPEGVSSFYLEKALPEGGGTNVVNVLLVDFRGFDTYGEITVLSIVALTVYALLRRFRPPRESLKALEDRRFRQRGDTASVDKDAELPRGTMLVPTVMSRFVMPISTLIALFFLLRGHNLPGGGFVAGLIFAASVILQYMMGGIRWVEDRSRIFPQYWIAGGLLMAGTAGISAWLFKLPFLSALAADINLGPLGHLHLSSVILFDLGVFAVVVGSTLFMLVALSHQSLRFYKKVTAEAAEDNTGNDDTASAQDDAATVRPALPPDTQGAPSWN